MTLGSITPGTIPRETPLLNGEKKTQQILTNDHHCLSLRVLPIFTPPCSLSVQSIFTQPTWNLCEILLSFLLQSQIFPSSLGWSRTVFSW